MHEKQIKPIIKVLEELHSRGHGFHKIFNDWLDLMIYALQGKDKEYLEIVDRYKNRQDRGKRDIDLFCKAFGLLMAGMKESNADLLGHIYGMCSRSDKAFGQFFTPDHVCDMMAQMTISEKGKERNAIDPCVGSGRMLISVHKIRPDLLLYGVDKDLTCVKMAALNMCFFNADSCIIHGDSLTQEYWEAYGTQRTHLGGRIFETDPPKLPRIEKPKHIKKGQTNLMQW